MHDFIALLQHIHHELSLLGPAFVPVALSKYRMLCAVPICTLCLCAAAADYLRSRGFAGTLWLLSAALLLLSFRGDSLLWNPAVGADLAAISIGFAMLSVLIAFWHEFQRYLYKARRERRKYRRVPGTFGAPLPGTGPRPTRNSSRI